MLECVTRETTFRNIIKSSSSKNLNATKFLDLACGRGCIVKNLVAEGLNYTGVEIRNSSVEMIRKMLADIPSSRFEVHQGSAIDFDQLTSETFDYILVAGLLYHLSPQDHEKLLTKCLQRSSTGVIIDTLFTNEKLLVDRHYSVINGVIVEGYAYFEHTEGDSQNQIEVAERSSYQAPGEQYPSYILTEESMTRLLKSLGYPVVYRYKYSPDVSEAPARPVHKRYADTVWTGYMLHERGVLWAPTACGHSAQLRTGVFKGLEKAQSFKLEFQARVESILRESTSESALIENFNRLAIDITPSLYPELILASLKNSNAGLAFILAIRTYIGRFVEIGSKADEKCLERLIGNVLQRLSELDSSYAQSFAGSLVFYFAKTLPQHVIQLASKFLGSVAPSESDYYRLAPNIAEANLHLMN
jgi:SAM-dependent methyltransferase